MQSARHFMKVNPFMVRLNAATGALNTAVSQHNPDEIARGLEDVGFWTARTVSEMISSSDEASTPAHLRLFKKGVSTLFEAQAANVRARKALRQMITSSTYSAPSSIENAGNGAFASRPFTPGEAVGVVREKSTHPGQSSVTWISTYLSSQLNHSPRPNLKLVPVPGPVETLAVVAVKPIAADEELTVHYFDPAWPEPYAHDLEIPPEWDQNALRATQTKDITESAKMSAGLILGPLLLLASERTSGAWATALVISGSATSAWSLWKWLERR